MIALVSVLIIRCVSMNEWNASVFRRSVYLFCCYLQTRIATNSVGRRMAVGELWQTNVSLVVITGSWVCV